KTLRQGLARHAPSRLHVRHGLGDERPQDALLHQVLHEEIILLSIVTEAVPAVEPRRRVTSEALPQGFHRVRVSHGFMERPDVQEIMGACRNLGIRAEPEDTTYYLGSERLLPSGTAPMMRWRKHLFGFMARNASA